MDSFVFFSYSLMEACPKGQFEKEDPMAKKNLVLAMQVGVQAKIKKGASARRL